MNPKRFKNTRFFCSSGAISACLIATFSLNSSVLAQDIWFVDGEVSACNNDGTSWANAFKFLQDALDQAVEDDQIWVAATPSNNPYRTDDDCLNPNGTGIRTTTFQLEKGVLLLGGFNGTELFASERDPIANVTVLTGDVATIPPVGSGDCYDENGNGTPGCDDGDCEERVCVGAEAPLCCSNEWDNFCALLALVLCGEAFHVVTAGSEIDDPDFTVIDGFTIRDGTANGLALFEKEGGGMLINGEPSVVRCLFTENTALTRGGGMSINGEKIQPNIINSVFDDNPGDQPLFVKSGAGLANFQADPSFVNCLFRDNVADQHGGAIHNSVGECSNSPSGPQCGRITLVNCTVYGNDADNLGTGWEGGGLYNNGNGSICDIDSSIFWDNAPDQIAGVVAGSTVDYTDVEGGSPIAGTDNDDTYPEFVLVPGNLRLLEESPCIDTGNPVESIIPCDLFNLDNDAYDCTVGFDEPTPDLDLYNRVLDGDLMGGPRVDMGSYEFVNPNNCPWDIDGNGSVGATDLLILLVAWGTDPGGPPDFDDNGDVGATDLLALLVNWGPCPQCSEEPLTLDEELDDACLSDDDWLDFLDVMENGNEDDKDRYNCWMIHHLFHCDDCSCSHLPECPSPDPFN